MGFLLPLPGLVELGLLVLATPTALGLPLPVGSGRWPSAAVAVGTRRVVAGAMVVAVVVVTVVVKSRGIQSGARQKVGVRCGFGLG